MRNVTINIVINREPEVCTFERGSIFETDDAQYILFIDPNKGPKYAALVNLATGEGIHKLKEVANQDFVTEDELATLNFTKSAPAVYVG
jgi:sensor domain CHASE-containing protein